MDFARVSKLNLADKNMTRIELCPEEIKVIKQQLSGKIEVWSATEEQQRWLTQVINKADALMRELNAFYETTDLIQWYWDKYQAQERGNAK